MLENHEEPRRPVRLVYFPAGLVIIGLVILVGSLTFWLRHRTPGGLHRTGLPALAAVADPPILVPIWSPPAARAKLNPAAQSPQTGHVGDNQGRRTIQPANLETVANVTAQSGSAGGVATISANGNVAATASADGLTAIAAAGN